METIQVVLTGGQAAKSESLRPDSRGAHEHLQRLHTLQPEEQERRGYAAQPQRVEEFHCWEEAAAWLDD
ncbi:MAG: hypothetical protein IT162_06440 [Bryobacterales bacterium]|nr:hypothetical protein [Bryobacterales bacterium]